MERRYRGQAGVVLRENKLLDPGHILMEFSRIEGNVYEISYNVGLLGFNRNRIFRTQVIENGQIPALGFSKQLSTPGNEKKYAFRVLNDSTNYIRLSAFDASLTGTLDSFYAGLARDIRARPYLVIDLRGNGGGSEQSYLGLLPYAYTRPLRIDSATVWVTPENIKRYESASSINNKRLIERMKAASPFSFIPYSEDPMDTWTLDSITTNPGKIAILHDRGTASAAEGMILYFLQSDKVISIGENSGGFIGFGNVMTAQTPCGHFTIQSTTTQYFEKSKYEFTGIPPMYPVPKSVDWVNYAIELMGK